MARIFLLLILIVAIGAGVGYYRGWFHISSDSSGGNPSYRMTVDKEKIKADETKAEKKLQDVQHKVQEKVAPTTRPQKP